MACLQIYQELLSLATFLRVHSNSTEVSYLNCQNRYPNLKTICHIRLKLFFWTKLQKSLFLAKYLISVAATLIIKIENMLERFSFISYLNLLVTTKCYMTKYDQIMA